MDKLPNDILELIFSNIVEIHNYFSIARTCKQFYNLLDQESQYLHLLQSQSISIPNKHIITAKEAVSLYCGFGCQLCKKPEFRYLYSNFVKIYQEFNTRCCNQCLSEQLINEFFLKPNEANPMILNNCRYKNIMVFGGRHGVTVYKCYWKADIKKANIEYLTRYLKKKKYNIEINDILSLPDFQCIYKPISKNQMKYFISLVKKRYICCI